MVVSSEHYSTSVLKSSLYAYKMTLTIQRFRPSDVGRYVCRAKNSFGEDDSSIRLYGTYPVTVRSSCSSPNRTASDAMQQPGPFSSAIESFRPKSANGQRMAYK
jgi:Immunoglobulin I-set domain